MQDAIKILAGAFSYVIYYLKPLSKAIAIPGAILILLNVPRAIPGGSIQSPLLFELLQWIPLTMIAIVTHRIILEGPESVPSWGIGRFGWREFSFIGLQFLLTAVIMLCSFLLLIPGIGWFLMIFSVLYLISRLSLVFPSVAIDRPMGFGQSWKMTRGHQLTMFLVVGLLPLVLLIVDLLLGFLLAISTIPGLFLLSVPMSLLSTVFVIAALSVSYRIIVSTNDQSPAGPGN